MKKEQVCTSSNPKVKKKIFDLAHIKNRSESWIINECLEDYFGIENSE